MFEVLDNGKPASEEGYPSLKGLGWKTNKFETLEQAIVYADKWFYPFCTGRHALTGPFDYSGYGDTAQIREIP